MTVILYKDDVNYSLNLQRETSVLDCFIKDFSHLEYCDICIFKNKDENIVLKSSGQSYWSSWEANRVDGKWLEIFAND